PDYFLKLVFWLIILPFGFEAIIVSFSNKFEKFRSIVDIALIFCFILLFVALFLLFSPNAFPKLRFINFILKNISVIGGIIGGFLLILFIVLGISSEIYMANSRNKFFSSFDKLRNKIRNKEVNNNFSYIVTITNDVLLRYEIVEKVFFPSEQGISSAYIKGYNIISCQAEYFLKNEIDLIKENVVIVTDKKNILTDIIKKLQDQENKILGIIAVNFEIEEEQKSKLLDIEWEECRPFDH
ncbi:MAG: hypothetical protein WC475_02585, partial [Candidatus Paceibacterota bacterium]